MRDDDLARRAAIIRKRDCARDVEFEAGEGGVVADGGHDSQYPQRRVLRVMTQRVWQRGLQILSTNSNSQLSAFSRLP
jgi:hypothetical protein